MQRQTFRTSLITLMLVCALAPLAIGVTPNVPRFITYQGRLTDASGVPVPDGAKSVRFIVWSDAVSVNPLDQVWNSGVVSVITTNGLFTARLGEAPQPAIDPYDFLDTARWIGVTVGADPEMTPRTRLGAVPYAFTAGSSMIALTTYDGAIGTTQIADGSVSVSDLSPSVLPAVGETILAGSTSSTTPVTLAQFSANAPGPGFLYVQVSGQWWLDADATSSTSLYTFFFMGLCDAPANTSTCNGTWQDYNYVDPDNASTSNSTHGFTISRVYTIGAGGPVSFFLNARVTNAAQTLILYGGTNATVMFFPSGLSVTNPVSAEPTTQRSGQ